MLLSLALKPNDYFMVTANIIGPSTTNNSLTLAWTASPSTDIEGYNILYGGASHYILIL